MKLAINGGSKVRAAKLPSQNTIGLLEKEAVERVMASGRLTGYSGNYDGMYGGPEIQRLEKAWANKFRVKHAIACNSATSAIHIACEAIGLRELDPVVVSPYSMTCSATIPLKMAGEGHYSTPWIDIERDYYNMSADSLENFMYRVTEDLDIAPKAIFPVSLFGQAYDADRINAMAKKHNAYVIEDACQALGSMHGDKYTGTLGDIGIFSLNLGKHLTCGEGGIIVTDNEDLALKCRMLMNHAEAVFHSMPDKDESHVNLIGFNLRMTELQAAIARVQLSRFDVLVGNRIRNAEYLIDCLDGLPYLTTSKTREGCTNSYYVLPLKFDYENAPYSRAAFVDAVCAELKTVEGKEHEGVPIHAGYVEPIYKLPVFGHTTNICPETERQQQKELIIVHRLFGPMADEQSLNDVVSAFEKVCNNPNEVIKYEKEISHTRRQ